MKNASRFILVAALLAAFTCGSAGGAEADAGNEARVLIDGSRPRWDGSMAPITGKPANLVEAAGLGDLATVRAMLEAGADVNAHEDLNFQYRHTTPLIAASMEGHVEVVQALLDAKADVNAADGIPPRGKEKYATTALMLAAGEGQIAVVRLLLAAGANVNARNEDGTTALMRAADNGHTEVVRTLLAANADPSPIWKFGGGRSALLKVMMAGRIDMAIVLVEGGANVDAVTDYGESPLRLAAYGRTPQHVALVKAMLARSANVEAGQQPIPGAECSTPQPAAPLTGLAEQLARANQIPGSSCVQGLRTAVGTPLGIAAGSGSVEIVQALIDARARVDARQSGWQTPLIIAARAGRTDVVRLLLAAGASTMARDARDQTALMAAEQAGHQATASLLRGAAPP